MKLIVSTVALTACLFPATLAWAADDTGSNESDEPVAPVAAWEFTLGQGYNQGFGEAVRGEVDLRDLSRGGPSLQLGFGYRMNPRWLVGVYAEGARYLESSAMPDHTEIYSTAFGLQANYHFMPFSSIDPWLSVGTGFRAYWVDREKASTESLYGFDITRVRVGADYQLGPSTRIGPMIGATLTTFSSRQDTSQERPETIEDPALSTFVFAGFQGRFEIGGQRVTEKQAARIARR